MFGAHRPAMSVLALDAVDTVFSCAGLSFRAHVPSVRPLPQGGLSSQGSVQRDDAAAGSVGDAPPASSSSLTTSLLRRNLRRTLSKKSGFRDAGLIFTPAKSWWAGLLLVVVSALVMAVTLLTAD